jgi:hypothetical protein
MDWPFLVLLALSVQIAATCQEVHQIRHTPVQKSMTRIEIKDTKNFILIETSLESYGCLLGFLGFCGVFFGFWSFCGRLFGFGFFRIGDF